jgi:hypothetical protein
MTRVLPAATAVALLAELGDRVIQARADFAAAVHACVAEEDVRDGLIAASDRLVVAVVEAVHAARQTADAAAIEAGDADPRTH